MKGTVQGKNGTQGRMLARYLKPLRDYVKRRLRYYVESEGIDPTQLPAEEFVNETFATALRRRGQDGQAALPWLREIARGVIGREVERLRQSRLREVSLDTPISASNLSGGPQGEEEFTLADVIEDANADLPAVVYENEEMWACVDRTFDLLPPVWREIFFLHAIDGLSLDEVAARQGRPVEAIIHSISQTREHLREALEEEFGELLEAA